MSKEVGETEAAVIYFVSGNKYNVGLPNSMYERGDWKKLPFADKRVGKANNWFLTAGELAYWLENVKKLKIKNG